MAGYGCSGHQAQGPVTTRAHLAVKRRDVTRLWKGRRLTEAGPQSGPAAAVPPGHPFAFRDGFDCVLHSLRCGTGSVDEIKLGNFGQISLGTGWIWLRRPAECPDHRPQTRLGPPADLDKDLSATLCGPRPQHSGPHCSRFNVIDELLSYKQVVIFLRRLLPLLPKSKPVCELVLSHSHIVHWEMFCLRPHPSIALAQT